MGGKRKEGLTDAQIAAMHKMHRDCQDYIIFLKSNLKIKMELLKNDYLKSSPRTHLQASLNGSTRSISIGQQSAGGCLDYIGSMLLTLSPEKNEIYSKSVRQSISKDVELVSSLANEHKRLQDSAIQACLAAREVLSQPAGEGPPEQAPASSPAVAAGQPQLPLITANLALGLAGPAVAAPAVVQPAQRQPVVRPANNFLKLLVNANFVLRPSNRGGTAIWGQFQFHRPQRQVLHDKDGNIDGPPFSVGLRVFRTRVEAMAAVEVQADEFELIPDTPPDAEANANPQLVRRSYGPAGDTIFTEVEHRWEVAGREPMAGYCDPFSMFLVRDELAAIGDQTCVDVTIVPANLKIAIEGVDELGDKDAERIAENWLRQKLTAADSQPDANALPDFFLLTRKILAQ